MVVRKYVFIIFRNALLYHFNVLAPHISSIACQGNYHYTAEDKEGHSWNVVYINGKHFLCDVMHDPGVPWNGPLIYTPPCGSPDVVSAS